MDSNRWKRLYNDRPKDYERLVQYEDHEGNLLPALKEIHPLEGVGVVEFGAGTGRITRQLAPLVQTLWALDITPAMIAVGQRHVKQTNRANWLLGIGDSRAMPLPNGCAGAAIAGWSLVQIAAWHLDNWRVELGKAVDEMIRVVRPGGSVIIIETLGTGATAPHPPAEHFKIVYNYLEKERGFSSTWIRTDYCFPTLNEARGLITPLFGEAVLDAIIETEAGVILPEYTGIWSRTVSPNDQMY